MHVHMPRLLALLAVLLLANVASASGGATGTQPLALAPLSNARSARAAFVIDPFQHDTPFRQQTAAGSVAPDLDEVLLGTRSLRVRTDGDGVQVNVRAEGVGPFDLATHFPRLHLKVDGVPHLRSVLLYVSDDGFATFDAYLLAEGGAPGAALYLDDGRWATLSTALGRPLSGEARVDLARVTDLQLSVVDDGAAPVTVWFGGLDAVERPERGVVTLVFDDARSGVHEYALPVMQRHGLVASVAVISELVGTPGFLTLEQLRTMERFAGWEMVAHHVTPLPGGGFDTLGEAELRAELEGVKRWLLEGGFRRGVDVVAYPYGGFDAATVEVVRDYFAAGRTILRDAGLETLPPADPYRIRALSVTPHDAPEALQAAIDTAARDRAWLILVFHQFTATEPEYDTEYPATDFALVMAHLAAADVDVLTLSEAVLER